MKTFKARGVVGYPVPDLLIEATEPIPVARDGCSWARELNRHANAIADSLFASLPGGVIDRLYAEFTRRKASQLAVPLFEPTVAAERENQCVDAATMKEAQHD